MAIKKWIPLTERFDFITSHRGFKVFDIKHTVSQFHQRFPNLSKDILVDYLKRGIDKIVQLGKQNEKQSYVIKSKKYKFGILLDWRQDKDSPSNAFNGFSSTVLDLNTMFPKGSAKDIMMVFESSEKIELD